MNTPSQQKFGPLPHWIRGDRLSSGYKGVFKDNNRGGWRVKADGSTIGSTTEWDRPPKLTDSTRNWARRKHAFFSLVFFSLDT